MTLAPVFYIMKVYNLSFLVLGGIYLNIQQVYAVYFSPTGHTKNLVCRLAADLAKALQVPLKTVSFDLPAEREGRIAFPQATWSSSADRPMPESFPIKSCRPTGRLIRSGDAGRRLVTYGNRSFDNALAELSAILEAKDEAFRLKAEVDAQKAEADKEIKQRRAEISRQENRIDQKETALDRKTEALEKREEELKKKHEEAEAHLPRSMPCAPRRWSVWKRWPA